MAQNEVILKLKVGDDGTLQLVTNKAKKAAKAVGDLGTATDKTTKSRDGFNKAEKGVAGLTSNSTKAFSKQAQTLGGSSGLVAAYATLAANIFAITAAFGALRRAAGLEQLEQGLIRVGNAAGANLPYVAKGLRDITGAAISTQEAMTAVALGTSAGFSTDQLEGLTRVAKGASLALGRDMGDAMSRLTRGAAKLEPEILDELGIMVRLDTATAAYATTLGKSSNQLTQFERRMAFTNAIITQGEEKFGDIANAIDPNPYDKLAATFSDLTKTVFNFINIALKPLVNFLGSNQGVLLGGIILFSSTVAKQMLPSIAQAAKSSRDLAEALSTESAEQLQSLKSTSKGVKVYNELLPKLQEGTATVKEKQKALRSLTQSEIVYNNQLKNNAGLTEADIALKNSQTAALAEVTAAKRALITAEKAEDLATAQSLKTDALLALQNKEYRTGIHLTIQAILGEIAAERASTLATTGKVGILHLLKSAYIAATVSAKAFGVALLAAIPIIGTVISIGSVLYTTLSSLFSGSKVTQAAEDAQESFDSFAKIAEQLSASIHATDNTTKQYVLTLNASVGVMDQIASAIKKVQRAQNDQTFETLTKLYKDLDEAKKQYQKSTEGSFEEYEANVKQAEILQKINNIRKNGSVIAKEAAKSTLDIAIINARATGALSESIIKQFEENISRAIDSGKLNTWKELQDAINNITAESKALAGNIKAVKDASAAVNKELIRLSTKAQGPFETLAKGIKEFQGAINTASKATKNGEDHLQKYLNVVKDTDPALYKLLNTLGDSEGFTGGVSKAISMIESYHTALRQTDETVKQHKQRMSELKGVISTFASATLEYYSEEKASINAQITLKEKELVIQEGILNNTKRVAEIRKEIETLQKSITSDSIVALNVREAELNSEKMFLNLQNKIVTNNRSLLEIDIARVRQNKINEVLNNKLRKTKNLTAKEERKLQEEADKKRLAQATIEHGLKIQSINLEFELMALKFKLLSETAKLQGTELSDNYLKMIEVARQSSISLANAQLEEQQKVISKDRGPANKQAAITEVQGLLGKGTSAYERLNNIGSLANTDQLEALDTLSSKIQAVQDVTNPMIENLKSLGPEGEVVASVAQGAILIADSWNTVGDTISSNATKLEKGASIANAAAQTFAAIGSIAAASSEQKISAIDQEIEAEKKRDGKSKESLQRIQALEAKKESERRKAFETDKKMKMGQAVMAGAAAVMQALASGSPPFNFVMAGITAALTAAQLAVISGTSYQGGSAAGASNIPSSVSIGERSNSVDLANAKNASGEQAYFRGQRGIGTGATNFTPAFVGVKHRAVGGTTGYMVGEQGPELFMPDTPGVIKPADQTANMGNPMNVSFQINAIDTQSVQDMLMNNRGTIIKNIRDAANQHGEFFLEQVREDSIT